jgi:hypothetical protein
MNLIFYIAWIRCITIFYIAWDKISISFWTFFQTKVAYWLGIFRISQYLQRLWEEHVLLKYFQSILYCHSNFLVKSWKHRIFMKPLVCIKKKSLQCKKTSHASLTSSLSSVLKKKIMFIIDCYFPFILYWTSSMQYDNTQNARNMIYIYFF